MAELLTIYHYEDEPETMKWLPGCLLNRYWSDHPDWTAEDVAYTESDDEAEVMFQLNPPSGPVTIRYLVFADKDEFIADFKPTSRDIVLLDVMAMSLDGEMKPYGPELYERARSAVGTDRIYFLTGYPGQIPEEIRKTCPPEHIVVKPPDAAMLCEELMRTLGVE